MKKKRVIRIILYILGALLFLFGCLVAFAHYTVTYKYIPERNKFSHAVEYINPNVALLNKDFEVCNEDFIIQYYNPERATYSKGKNGLRKFILTNYENRNYTDSGYLNFRFVINCKGKAGRYVIHENDLDLTPKTFNKDLVQQLFKLTIALKEWKPNFTHNEFRDSHMYISYRIENGEITEIIP